MGNLTVMPTVESKPVLLRALKQRWMNYYMLGPGEAAGDLFWWDGKGKQPAHTEKVDPATVNAPTPPRDLGQSKVPGGGPKSRGPFAPA